jgi:ribonuclease HI
MRLVLYFDGSAFPNAPEGGDRGIGVVLHDTDGHTVKEIADTLPGKGSSNTAEYEALIRGLQAARELDCDEITVRGDSQLVIRQLEGKYRVKEPKLKPLFERVVKLAHEFQRFEVQWIPREQNKQADALSTRMVEKAAQKSSPAAEPKKKQELGSSPSRREHDILCPQCRKPCTLTIQKSATGEERIRQVCPTHGFVTWAPFIEPFVSIARKSAP